MRNEEAYRLSMYEDFGFLNENKKIRLKRHLTDGTICVEKHISIEEYDVYMFLNELDSQYIPHIYECIRDDGDMILIEEYITGQTLTELVYADMIDEKKSVNILLNLCQALKPLHNANPPVICRDLKSDNIMIDSDGNLKIVDFDIARVYEEGKKRDTRLLGTEEYAAPEQYGFSQTDQRTDIYALGVLLNFMLTKKYPIEQIASGPAEQIISTCISMEPQNRYQSVEELENAVRLAYVGIQKKSRSQNAGYKKHLPPGFRSGKWLNMLIASFVYISSFMICMSLKLTHENTPITGFLLWLERIIIWISAIIYILFVCNYLGCRDQISIFHPKSPGKKFILYLTAACILFIASAWLAALLETFFY